MTMHPSRRRATLAALLTSLLVTTACSADAPEAGDDTAVADAADDSDVEADENAAEEPAATETASTPPEPDEPPAQEPGGGGQTISFTWVDGQAYDIAGECRSTPDETARAGEFLSLFAAGGPIEVDVFGFRSLDQGGDDGIAGSFIEDGRIYSVTDAVADGPGTDFTVVLDMYEGLGTIGADPDYEITVTCTS